MENGKKIKFTIVVPVHNDEMYVGACLDSLVNQTLREIEIIAVDDASSDGSLQILKEYQKNDARIQVISFSENRSAFQARKTGVEKSRGKYIMFADADDSLELDACEKLWHLEEQEPVDILHFGTNVITDCQDDKRIGGYRKLINPRKEKLYCGEIFDRFVNGNFEGHLWNKVFNRELAVYALTKTGDSILPKGQDKYFYWIMAFHARTYRGCPEYNLYNYSYGAGVEGEARNIDLETFELFCKQAWTENAIESFMEEETERGKKDFCEEKGVEEGTVSEGKTNSQGKYAETIKKSRRNLLRHCIKNWKLLDREDRAAGIHKLFYYWNKEGDVGEIIGAWCDLYKDTQDELIETVKDYKEKFPLERKKIKTIGTYYHSYNNGGIQRVMSKLMELWVEKGYRVILFTDFEKEDDYALPEGVERVIIPFSGKAFSRNYTERGRSLEKTIMDLNVDVMVYHDYLGKSLLWDILLSWFCGVPFVLYYHNVFTKYLLLNDERFYTIPRVSQLTEGIVVLSEIDKIFWRNFHPNVWVVKNPLTFELEDTVPGRLENQTVIWVGRLDEIHKRFQEPVTIMRSVLKELPDAKLFIVGKDDSGKNYLRLQQRINKLHLEDSIILCGFQKDVGQFYQNASVYLMTSSHEGYPMTLLEGLSFGLPTVMYELPYLELVKGNEGIIAVKQEDQEKTAEEIIKLLKDEDYRRTVGGKGRKFLEQFYAADHLIGTWEEIFRSIGRCPDREVDPDEKILFETLLMYAELSQKMKNGDSTAGLVKKEEVDRQKKLLEAARKEIEELKNYRFCLEETRKSFSYRLGMVLTAVPRWIIGLIRKIK